MGCLLSSREGIIWIRLRMARCQPHDLEGQEGRELAQKTLERLALLAARLWVTGQEPCAAEPFLPSLQCGGRAGRQFAQCLPLGKPHPGVFASR